MSLSLRSSVFSLAPLCSIFLLFFCVSLSHGRTTELRAISVAEFQDIGSKKVWQLNRSKRIKSIDAAKKFLATLNQGENSDWRLPTKKELYELFSTFDLQKNGDIKTRLEGYYWLADDKGEAFVGKWEIGDQCGPSRTFSEGKAGYIRAVRP